MTISIYKTKKLHIVSAIVVALVLMFSFTTANASYNDATLTTDTVISVNSISLNVSGSSAVVESITVNSSSFSVTLLPNSSITVVSNDKKTLTPNVDNSDFVRNTCSSDQSSVILTADPDVSSATISITPSSTACDASTTSTSSGGGGGGGSSVASAPGIVTPLVSRPQIIHPDGTIEYLDEQETTTTVTTDTTTTVGGSSLTQGQVDSIIGLLKAFGAEQSIIDNVFASLTGGNSSTATATQTSGATSVSAVFTRGFAKGASHSDIKRLQQLLNSDSDTRVAVSGVGSAGNETNYFGSLTEKAVQKFQMKHGVVSSSNDPGYGYLGPKTRAKLNQVFGQ